VALVELCIVSISLSIITRRDLHAAGTGGGAGRPKDCQYSINKNANYSIMHTHILDTHTVITYSDRPS